MSGDKPPWAYVALLAPGGDAWQIGVAVEGEPGYHPGTQRFPEEQAKRIAATLNEERGLSERDAYMIVASTMRPLASEGVGL